MKSGSQFKQLIPLTYAIETADSGQLAAKSIDGNFHLDYIMIAPLRELELNGNYQVRALSSTGSFKLACDIDFYQVTKSNAISSNSYVNIVKRDRAVSMEDFAGLWNLMTYPVMDKTRQSLGGGLGFAGFLGHA